MRKSEFELISGLAFLLKQYLSEDVIDEELERDAYLCLSEAEQWVDDHSNKESVAV